MELSPSPTPKSSISDVFGHLEGWIDDMVLNDFSTIKKPYDLYSESHLKSSQLSQIIEHYSNRNIVELLDVLEERDEQLLEAYSHWTRAELQKLLDFCHLIVSDAKKYRDEQKEVNPRRPRKKKHKSAAQRVEKIQFLVEHGDFRSIDPTLILGSQRLFLFNVNSKTLYDYRASRGGKLSIDSNKVIGFCKDLSGIYKLKKPNEIIKRLSVGSIGTIDAIIEDIQTFKENDDNVTQLHGRFGKNVLIVRKV